MKFTKSLLETALGLRSQKVADHSPKGNYVAEADAHVQAKLHAEAQYHKKAAEKLTHGSKGWHAAMAAHHEAKAEYYHAANIPTLADKHGSKAEDHLEKMHEELVEESMLAEDKVTIVHKGEGGHHRITVGTATAGPLKGKHFVSAKFDSSNDPKKPTGHGSDQSLANYVHSKHGDGTAEKSAKLRNALIAAHKTGDKKKVLDAVKAHGYSHHGWQLHEELDESKDPQAKFARKSRYTSIEHREPDFKNKAKFHDFAQKLTARLQKTHPHLDIVHKHDHKSNDVYSNKTGEIYAEWDHKRGHGHDLSGNINLVNESEKFTDENGVTWNEEVLDEAVSPQQAQAHRSAAASAKDQAEQHKMLAGRKEVGSPEHNNHTWAYHERMMTHHSHLKSAGEKGQGAHIATHKQGMKDHKKVSLGEAMTSHQADKKAFRRSENDDDGHVSAVKYSKPKHFHEVPYKDKEHAKGEGMRWDNDKHKWYHTDAGKSATSKFRKLTEEEVLDEAKKPVPTHIVHVDRGGHSLKNDHQIHVVKNAGSDHDARTSTFSHYSHSHPQHKITKIEKYDSKNPAHKHYVMNEEVELEESYSLETLHKMHRDEHENGGGTDASWAKLHAIRALTKKYHGKAAHDKMVKDTDDYASHGGSGPARMHEAREFHNDPKPHSVTPTQDRFGKARYDVKNDHDWRNQTIASHPDHKSASDHADALNAAHRKKHNINESTGGFNHRKAAQAGVMHSDDRQYMKPNMQHDFYSSKNGDKIQGTVHTVTKDHVIMKANKQHHKDHGKFHTFKFAKSYDRMNESLDEEVKGHRFAVTISDPHHTMASMRDEKVEKFINVKKTSDKFHASALARAFYKRNGYKVHDVQHHSALHEDFEMMSEEHATREQAEKRMAEIEKKHPMAKHTVMQGRRSGKWHVVRHTSGGMHVIESVDDVVEDCGLESKADFNSKKRVGLATSGLDPKDPNTFSAGAKHLANIVKSTVKQKKETK